MAYAREVLTGKNGAVKIANATGGGSYYDPVEGTYSTIAEVRSWSVEHTMDTVEFTNMSSNGIRRYKPTFKTWTGTVELYIPHEEADGVYTEKLLEDHANNNGVDGVPGGDPSDDTDYVTQITVGNEFYFQLYVDDSQATTTSYDGYGIVTGVSRSVAFDGMAEMTITVQGNSDLTLGTDATGYAASIEP
jgi:predicted secreted protein